jgi:hypothetical protein
MKKRTKKIFLISLIFILILLSIIILFFINNNKKLTCGDGTFEGNCSSLKPYFCLNKTLIEKASVCECPKNLAREGDSCISRYQISPKNISLKYVLHGKKGRINFVVYDGMIDYISQLPKSIYYSNEEKPSRQDFKLKKINEKEQRELLLPLVVEIQNIAEDKNDRVRIAVSIVQQIPYGESIKNITLGINQINYSRYAYEVLYDNQGACEGKSELLAFLLKEMGYSVVLFYYPLENHEVVGIKCPDKYSLKDTGYCFIETTGPSIISNDQEYYSEWGKLSSNPEVIFISEGNSLDYLYEYKDAKDFIKLNDLVENEGELNIFRHLKWESLKEKYGLRDI